MFNFYGMTEMNIVAAALGSPLIIGLIAAGLLILLYIIYKINSNSQSDTNTVQSDNSNSIDNRLANVTVSSQNNDDADESELIAIFTACIMASMRHTTNCKLVVKSFKRVNDTAPVWNKVSKREAIEFKY